jgi:predicted metal-dependent phosphoesterase TrpH
MDFDLLERRVAEGWGVDLHAHSRHSDGAWSPTELVNDALIQGVRVMALTDHDTVLGQPEMQAAGADVGMAIVTGAEVTTKVGARSYHLLCYDLDPSAEIWNVVQANRHGKIGDYYLTVLAQLRERGYAVAEEHIRTPEGGFIRNPISGSLVAAGLAPDLKSAQTLVKSLQLDFPVHLIATPVEQLGHLLGGDGALVSVAHPAREERGVSNRLVEEDLLVLKEHLPVAALEAHHPYHSAEDVVFYRELAERHGLAVTCGSDAHGWAVSRPPLAHAPALCRAFLERLLARRPVLARAGAA